MSKSTYKRSMQQQRAEQRERDYARKINRATTFIPSKDNPVELTTARFGNPRAIEADKPRFEVTRKNFKSRKRAAKQ